MVEPEPVSQGEPDKDSGQWGRHEDEWWRTDKLDAIGWAAAFIWGGLVLLATNTGAAERYSWWNGWSVFFIGAGIIVIAIALIRLLVREHRHKTFSGLIIGLVLLGIGLGEFFVWFWSLVLFAIGALILRNAFFRSSRR